MIGGGEGIKFFRQNVHLVLKNSKIAWFLWAYSIVSRRTVIAITQLVNAQFAQ